MPAQLKAETGPLKGLIIDFENGEEWTIGSDPDLSDFVLDDETVFKKQLLCQKTEDGLLLFNLHPDNPVFVNGEELKTHATLKEGDEVEIGKSLFVYTQEEKGSLFDTIFEDTEEEPVIENEIKEDKTSYDTIFEEGEEDLPFNLMGDSPLILKVITGPNAGAEIGLQKGRTYTIGKDPASSDIVFQDLSVSKNHARLTIQEDGSAFIEDLDSKNGTTVNNHTITEKKEISTQDLICAGTTTFLIIDREKEHQTIFAPSTPFEMKEELEEEIKEEIAEEKAAKVPWKEQIIPFKHLIFAGSFCLMFFIVFLSFFSLFKASQVTVASKDHSEQIQEALKAYENITFNYSPSSGTIFLVGHVITAVQNEELLYELHALPFITSIENNIIIDDYITKSMNEVLIENEGYVGVNLSASKPGHFVINGYVKTMQEKEALDDYLIGNFPYPHLLTNQVVVEEELELQVINLLQRSSFSAISPQISNGAVFLTGRYDEKESSKWNALIKELQKMQGVREVRNLALAVNANTARVDLSQNYKVTGFAKHNTKDYSVVINGQIVAVGEAMDGFTVTKILPSEVLLEKEGVKYKINYTR